MTDAVLRRNVIERDWHNGICKYQLQHGRMPNYAEMNRWTCSTLIMYMHNRYNRWNRAYACEVHITAGQNIYFDGVKIYLNDILENEVVMFR